MDLSLLTHAMLADIMLSDLVSRYERSIPVTCFLPQLPGLLTC